MSVPSFRDLPNAAGLKELNAYLATRSYVSGYTASVADAKLLPKLPAVVDATAYPHVKRWLNHITSFPPAIRALWSSAAAGAAPAEEEDDDDFMTSLDDDEDGDDEDGQAAAQALIAKKNAERDAAKRAQKGGPQAKSSLILDIKPEDSDTNMDDLLTQVKEITMDGLTWGGHEFIPVAFGIKKLRIICIVIDELVSVDDLQEQIEALSGVQSTDIYAFNKL